VVTSSRPLTSSVSPLPDSTRPTTKSTTIRRTCRRNSDTVMSRSGWLAFFTTGCLLYASRAGPVAAQTKSGPRIPASQKSRNLRPMLSRIPSSTRVSQPGRAV